MRANYGERETLDGESVRGGGEILAAYVNWSWGRDGRFRMRAP
jgi:hypothetical protein